MLTFANIGPKTNDTAEPPHCTMAMATPSESEMRSTNHSLATNKQSSNNNEGGRTGGRAHNGVGRQSAARRGKPDWPWRRVAWR